MAMHIG
jgi:hypothetical protein